MRRDRAHEVRQAWGLAAAALTAGAGLGFAVGGPLAGALGTLGGLATGSWLVSAATRRRERRRQLLSEPFPPAWREFLLATYDHYERLPLMLRARFEDDVRVFIDETRITGIEVAIDDEIRLLVAASAVTLSLAWHDYEWDALSEVLIYPHDFDRDYGFEKAELAGQAHPWGTVILSLPTLHESFRDPDDGYHVGLHEFAHLLDVQEGHMNGIFAGLSTLQQREWVTLMDSEMARLRRGHSVVDDYGSSEPAEFLAVAVEAFFETPLALRQRHRELYTFLGTYFSQDPAAWDDARGLTL
jgi:Mlc titration factor MtfA (ptsG expression regulator)